MKQVVPLQVLKRVSERLEQPRVEWSLPQVSLHLAQRRAEHDGGGLAWLRLTGEVDAKGEGVAFHLPEDALVEGAVTAAEAHALAQAGPRLLEALAQLCRCAHLPEDCDCCEACGGEGWLARGGAKDACWTCAGLGYDEDRVQPGRPGAPVVRVLPE